MFVKCDETKNRSACIGFLPEADSLTEKEEYMYIQNLRLQNFRKFEDQTFGFHPKFTAIIGDNAAGKTQILDALAVILGSFQSKLSHSSNAPRDIRREEVRVQISLLDAMLPSEETQYPVTVSSAVIYQKTSYRILRTKRSDNGRTTYNGKNPLFTILEKQGSQVQAGEGVFLPLLAYYGTGRAQHLKRHRLSVGKLASRFKGYHSSLDPNADLKVIQEWVSLQALATVQNGQETRPMRLLKQALQILIPGCCGLKYDVGHAGNYLQFETGELELLENTSDGYRSMTLMLMDLIRRWTILNPHTEDLSQVYGVVLIDELDLFLHPRWQRRVVGDLQKTFPNVQFVATTHSPFIIQSVQDGCVLDLENMENIQKPGTASPAPTAEYESRSIEDITEDLMGVIIPQRSRRYHEMYETAKEYYTLLHSTAVSEEEKRQKRQKLDALIAPFSQDVAYHAFLEMERLAMEANDASSK